MIIDALFGINIFLTLGKVFLLVADFLFIIFLIIVLKQVLSMQEIVMDENDSFILKSAVIVLLIVSVSLFLTALVIL